MPARRLCCRQGELERGSSGWGSKPGALPSTGCWARARTPGEMEPREEQSHSCYKLEMGKRARERQGMRGALEGQEPQARTKRKGSEEPWQGAVLSATEDKQQPPGGTLGAHPGSLESFLPLDAGHEGHLRGAGAAGTWPAWPKGALARGRAQRCRGRQKTPRDTR